MFSDDTISNTPSANTPPPTSAPADQQQPVAPSSPVQDSSAQNPRNQAPAQAQPQPTQQNPQTDIVSNAPAQDDYSNHPAVKKASLLYRSAEALTGGPRYSVSIDDQGNRIKTPVPVGPRQIGLALALEAIQGSLTGLAAGKGRGPGAAGAAAMNQQITQRQQADERQNEQAQQDFSNRASTLARKAQTAEVNSRTLLNTSEAEKYGADAIDSLVAINRASGVLDPDSGSFDNDGKPMTQAEMMAAMQSGKLNSTDKLGPIAGRTLITDKNGNSRWEALHLIVRDPNSTIHLSQEQFDKYAEAGIPGYPKGAKIGDAGVDVKISTLQRANEIMGARVLSDYRLKDMKDVLSGTPYADRVPSKIDFSAPGVENAMKIFQRYVSHSNQHGMDLLESISAMSADKRDPRTGAMQPNPDSKFADTIAGAFGGWPVLQALHNQIAADKKTATDFAIIDSEAKANAVIATPNKFTKDQINSAKNFLTLSEQQGAKKAAQEARSRAIAEGKDVEAMYKTGVNPVSGERLSLANAPDGAFVDSKGRVIPQNQQSFYKPSQNERQTADTARQALAISADLRAAVAKNPNLVGPLLGNSKEGLAKLGFGTEQAQKFLDDISFLQSASTKVHTGRFSSEILHKMGNMIKAGMNAQQFVGGLNSIDEVMQRYSKEDQLVTVADYREMQQAPSGASSTPQLSNLQVNPQTGQQIGWNGSAWVDAQTGKAVK